MVALYEPEVRLVRGTLYSKNVEVLAQDELYGFTHEEVAQTLSQYMDAFVEGRLYPHEVMWEADISDAHKLAWYELWLTFKDEFMDEFNMRRTL